MEEGRILQGSFTPDTLALNRIRWPQCSSKAVLSTRNSVWVTEVILNVLVAIFLKGKRKRKKINLFFSLTQWCCCSVAKSCPTLCYPMDCSTPGLPVPHNLLEFTQIHIHWIGDIIISNVICIKIIKETISILFSHSLWNLVFFFFNCVFSWPVVSDALQPHGLQLTKAILSIGFSRQKYWSGLSFPSPGDLPNPGIEPASVASPALAGSSFTTSTTWEALIPQFRY